MSEVQELTDRYCKLRECRRELRRLFDELLVCADALQDARCREGRKLYSRLAARAKRGKSAETKKTNRRSKR